MAADDIYSVVTQYELPTGSATVKLYFEQTIDQTASGNSNQVFANAYDNHFGDSFRDLLASDCWRVGFSVRKLTGPPDAAFRFDYAAQAGLRSGASLPNNNCLQVRIKQSTQSRKHDGRIYLPGVPELDTVVAVVTANFAENVYNDLITLMRQEIAEESGGAGRWSLGVIDQAVLNVPTPPAPKDWEGAFATSTGVTGHVIIATQRRRQTKVMSPVP